jgi:hypothetical protein
MLFNLSNLISSTPGLEELSVSFITKEIDHVIKTMLADKSPRPDGFNGLFLKSCWSIIKHDIYRLCYEFYGGQLSPENLNMGHITLISKVNSPRVSMITNL